jgi:hypothetical protein
MASRMPIAAGSAPLKIHALGLTERMRNTVQLFLAQKGARYCLWGIEASANACLIDMDVINAAALREQQRSAYPDRPLMLLSLWELSMGEQEWLIRKPVDLKLLAEVLESVHKQVQRVVVASTPASQLPPKAELRDRARRDLERPRTAPSPEGSTDSSLREVKHELSRRLDNQTFHRLCGCASDIDVTDPAQQHGTYYEPRQFLQGALQTALQLAQQQSKAIRISGSLIESIVVDPVTDCVWTAAQERWLRAGSIVPLKEGRVQLDVLTSAPDPSAGGPYSYPFDSFLWKVALWTARGRVPSGTDLDAPIQLEAWPNFTRLWIPPHALRIAALWSRHPRSLLSTARAIAVPQRYVFAFYSAVHAIGLVAQARDISAAPSPVEPKQHRSLLQRILDRLLSQ